MRRILGPLPNWTFLAVAARPATATSLAAAVGARDLGALDGVRRSLADAVGELAARAGCAWTVDHDDPLVLLVRALDHLARRDPGATTSAGAAVVEALDGAPLRQGVR